MSHKYMSLQGKIFVGERDANGNPKDLRWVGNVSSFQIDLGVEKLDHYESYSGSRLKDLDLVRQKNATFTMTAEEWLADNVALGLYGKSIKTTGGTTVSGEVVSGATLAVGERYLLTNPRVSDVVVTDNKSETLEGNVDYTLDEKYGAIELLRLQNSKGAFEGPLTVAYTAGEVTSFGMFTESSPERYVRFEGVNTVNNNEPVIVELYRASFDPVKGLSLIAAELNTIELSGSILADSTKPSDGVFGQFGKFIQA